MTYILALTENVKKFITLFLELHMFLAAKLE